MIPNALKQYVADENWPKTTGPNDQATGERMKAGAWPGEVDGAVFGNL